MIIKITIAIICIIVDTLYESRQENIGGGGIVPPQELQFVRDAVVTYEKLGTPRFFITNVEELDVNHVGIIFNAVVDLDKDWLKEGDIVVLERDGTEWYVKHDVKKYNGVYRYHLKSFIRSTKYISAGDTIYRDRKILK
jgi:hypothetical protein